MAMPSSSVVDLPAGGPAREVAIKQLFMPMSARQRLKDDHVILTAGDPEVDWSRFMNDWTWSEVVGTAQSLVNSPRVARAYVGITSSPLWRWKLCEGHHNDDFAAHCYTYDEMAVLTADYADPIKEMESMLVDELTSTANGWKVQNKTNYVTGPVGAQKLFLYMCVTYQVEPLDKRHRAA